MIYELTIHEWVGPREFDLDLTTEAGTYVKEFVHGDRGRTRPYLGDILGCATDILQLDVTGLLDMGPGSSEDNKGSPKTEDRQPEAMVEEKPTAATTSTQRSTCTIA
uniref:tRNA pseudouridine(55) synthase n=1 Tax=Lotharella oceanica TaxID=641309 RepID=A0A7S2TFV9_9EUKA|mmetsp:Transcript_122/g.264  ORF Transcript_122/g.264 Transcript_122/m.264 type:complete len:107 (+) Transcript_122:1-321(+)